MSDDVFSSRSSLAAVISFAVAVVLIAIDLYIDFVEGVGPIHLVAEIFVFVVAIAGTIIMYRQLDRTRLHLAGALVEAEHWKKESSELIQGLAVAIEHQLDRWGLTAAEADVAVFLLKGLSLKEIAKIRSTSERTVREQARSVYRKSGLAGRTTLSAFFLEDLLLPHVDR